MSLSLDFPPLGNPCVLSWVAPPPLSSSRIGDLEETREDLFPLPSSYLGRTWGRRKGPRLFVLLLGGPGAIVSFNPHIQL